MGASRVAADRLALISHIFNEPIHYFYRDINFDSIMIGDTEKPTVIHAQRQRNLQIMLVEDSPADAILFREAVEPLDSVEKIIIEHHGNNVMPYLLNHQQNPNHQLPDIIFLDLSLSSGNGFEIIKKIKDDQTLRHIIVVVISGSINWDDMMRSYRLGAASYILKTSQEKSMPELLREVIHYWGDCVILPTM